MSTDHREVNLGTERIVRYCPFGEKIDIIKNPNNIQINIEPIMIDPYQHLHQVSTVFLGSIVLCAVLYIFSSRTRIQSLPPGGRGRWPLIGDTLRLLNPRTMAVYQIECRRIFGNIWKTSVLFNNAVFVANDHLSKELSRVERIHKDAT